MQHLNFILSADWLGRRETGVRTARRQHRDLALLGEWSKVVRHCVGGSGLTDVR
jgi:hypothetical protein